VLALLAAACSGDDTETSPVSTEAAATQPEATEPGATTPAETTPAETTPDEGSTPSETVAPGDTDFAKTFPDLPPPDGDEMTVGLVNTEGPGGLDFPDIRLDAQGAIDYLNEHGGFGGRPVKLEVCVTQGSPESSQACAQELVGKNVELVMVGLDLFPDYATYSAAGVPVIGVLPILPGDYTAEALFLTGGNATSTAVMAAVAKDYFQAETIGIVSADNAGANGTEASLVAALDKAGIAHFTVKGGDNETDAGYQGLMREAAEDEPDLLISLYADAGCIGTIRGRASLGIEIPVLTTSICASRDVIEQVGDDAIGWHFVGSSTQEDTPELAILQAILAPVLDIAPEEVDSTALGLGALAVIMTMSLAMYSNMMAADGLEVSGAALYQYLQDSTELGLWPAGTPIACASAAAYPAICSFTFPVAEYQEGGAIVTVEGLEAVSSRDYLP
jgi:branched-chain amino acid transport system substrate-binding protein